MPRILFLLAAAVAPLAAADVSGKWTIDGEIAGNVLHAECTFKQEGAAITGQCKFPSMTEGAPVKGEVKEQKATFQHDVTHEGTLYTLVYTATLESDDKEMKGSVEAGGAFGDFKAKKSE